MIITLLRYSENLGYEEEGDEYEDRNNLILKNKHSINKVHKEKTSGNKRQQKLSKNK